MARTPESFTVSAVDDYLYERVDCMPWDTIEAAVRDALGSPSRMRPLFSTSDRHEIFLCTGVYAETRAWASNSLSVEAFRTGRAEIIDALRRVHEILVPYMQEWRSKAGTERARAFQALLMYHGSEEFSLANELDRVARAAEALTKQLEKENHPEDELNRPEVSRRQPEVVALEAFIQDVLNGADRRPARGATGYLEQPDAYERVRWGIPIGPRAKAFRAFVNSVLGLDLSEDQVREGFRRMGPAQH